MTIRNAEAGLIGRHTALAGITLSQLISVPRRGILFLAKTLVTFTVSFAAGTATALTSFLLGQAGIGSRGAPMARLADHVVIRAVGMGAYLAMTSLLGPAVGMVRRSSAGALGIISGGQIMTVVPDSAALPPLVGFGLFYVTVIVTTLAALFVFRRWDI